MPEQTIIIKKVVRGGGHAHHGGSWKVAYADFVTAMMAFFMVMWLMGLSAETRAQIQGYFNDPLGFSKSEPKTKTLLSIAGIPSAAHNNSKSKNQGGGQYRLQAKETEQMESVAKQIRTVIINDQTIKSLLKGVRIEVTPEGLLIELTEVKGAVFFESGSATLLPQARKLIDRLAPILAATKHPLYAQGHTDAAPLAGPKGNIGLSADRACSLAQELITSGVKDDQLKRIEGLGSTQLLDPVHPTAYCNRRVTILMPRLYKPTDSEALPGDSLRYDVHDSSQPQPLNLKPGTPIISGGG